MSTSHSPHRMRRCAKFSITRVHSAFLFSIHSFLSFYHSVVVVVAKRLNCYCFVSLIFYGVKCEKPFHRFGSTRCICVWRWTNLFIGKSIELERVAHSHGDCIKIMQPLFCRIIVLELSWHVINSFSTEVLRFGRRVSACDIDSAVTYLCACIANNWIKKYARNNRVFAVVSKCIR